MVDNALTSNLEDDLTHWPVGLPSARLVVMWREVGAAAAGVHGASLTFTAYQERHRAALLEVTPPGFEHYHNLAHNVEVLYRSVSGAHHIYSEDLKETLWEVMREVALMRVPAAAPAPV